MTAGHRGLDADGGEGGYGGGRASGDAERGRILVAGVGNIFLADDGFGPEVVTALRGRPLGGAVHVEDFGIRGFDLAYRLLDGYDAAVLVDAAPRGGAPGTLYVVEPELPGGAAGPATAGAQATPAPAPAPEAHGMDPVRVLALAGQLGEGALPRVLVLGCEPQVRMRGDETDVVVGLSEPVRAAVAEAVELLGSLTAELLSDPRGRVGSPSPAR